jgi:hypothetical protein
MAPYKKKPKNLVPIWSSSMKAVFCWSRALPEPGLHAGRRRFCAVPAAGPRSRLFPASVSLPKESGLRFMPSFIVTKTSNPHKWCGFLLSCSNICGAMLFFSGMGAGATKGQWSESFFINIRSFILNGFPDTRPSLTLMSSFGACLRELWQTGHLKMSISLSVYCIRNFCGCAVPRSCFGPA